MTHRVGPLLFQTESLKLALKTEVKNWQRMYAKHLNDKCAREMDEILEFFDNMQKKLRCVFQKKVPDKFVFAKN